MDDPLFIWAAKHILHHPLDFYGFRVNWYGLDMPMYLVAQNPPLNSYYIAAWGAITGFGEKWLHAAFLLPAAGAGLGTYLLARKFTRKPLLACALSLLTPAFLVAGTNVMCDVMLLFFYVWAIYLWVTGWRGNNRCSFWLRLLPSDSPL